MGGAPARAAPAAAASLHHPSRPSSGLAANCGVFVGIAYNEYIGMAAAHGGVSTYSATGGSLSVSAGAPRSLSPTPNVTLTLTLPNGGPISYPSFCTTSSPSSLQNMA